MVFAKYVSGFHHPPSEAKTVILFPTSCPCKSEVGFGGKKWSTIFESTDPSQVQIEYKELENCAFAVLIWIKSNR